MDQTITEKSSLLGRSTSNGHVKKSASIPSLIPIECDDQPTLVFSGKRKKKLRRYYEQQEELQKDIESDRQLLKEFEDEHLKGRDGKSPIITRMEAEQKQRRRDTILAQTSVVLNVVLLVSLFTIFIRSMSMSILATAVDAAADLTSGIVLWAAEKMIRKRDGYKYPRGRTRLEPLAIVIVSVVMAVVNLEVVVQSVEKILGGNLDIEVDKIAIAIMAVSVGLKIVLMTVCCMFSSPNAQVLAQDLRNDCLLNVVAIICAIVGHYYWPYLDPVGAILVCIFITVGWCIVGAEQADIMSGRTAPPPLISRILAVCVDHNPKILQIESILAFHFGHKYMVEIHVVMDETESLKDVHDIVEPLQLKIEHLPFVEHCYLHVDYDCDHHPHSEHKIV